MIAPVYISGETPQNSRSNRNNFKKAQYYIETSLTLNNDNSVVLEHLGDIMMKINKTSDAMNFYRRALSIDKSNQRLKEKVSPE